MLNGLDLFSGIGGIGIALKPWVRTVTYCEGDRYAQGVLLSRMQMGDIDEAPIWDDVRTLTAEMLPPLEIIFGGFPCQDISVAGNGKGLAGERSGLFYEIIRLTKETRAPFVFLENVPAIRTRGLREVIRAFTEIGYDCRWTCLSAASIGAPHKRERWFLLAANTKRFDLRNESRGRSGTNGESSSVLGDDGEKKSLADSGSERCGKNGTWEFEPSSEICNSSSQGLQVGTEISLEQSESIAQSERSDWWSTEPNVGRVAHGIPLRSHRIKCLGNSVVPQQARTAFKRLMGLEIK